MPLPLVELNRSTMACSAAAFAPVWVCQSVSAIGEPDRSMSAWVDWAGAGDAAPLHAWATTMTAAMTASFNRMDSPPFNTPTYALRTSIRFNAIHGYRFGPPPGSDTAARTG